LSAFDVGEALALMFGSQSSLAKVSVSGIDRHHKSAQLLYEDHGSDTSL